MMGGFFVHNDLDITMPIYRCIPYSRVIELLEHKAMYFRKVIKWEDTWEIPSRFFTDNEKNTGVNYFGNSQVVASNLYGTLSLPLFSVSHLGTTSLNLVLNDGLDTAFAVVSEDS